MTTNPKKIGIITIPMEGSGTLQLCHLVDILSTFSSKLIVITGNEAFATLKKLNQVEAFNIAHEKSKNNISRILSYLIVQISILGLILQHGSNIKKWIFFIGGDTLVIPMIYLKIRRIPFLILFAGSSAKTLESKGDNFYRILHMFSLLGCGMSEKIVLYSTKLITEYSLEKYAYKVCIGHEHYIDFGSFIKKTNVSERENLIGFIGRLSEEKGVRIFLETIGILSEEKINFVIAGDGELKNMVIQETMKYSSDKVNYCGWVSHGQLPDLLNRIKLLVMPSSTEGLPNIMLEAMACGTPVLATSVGAITDLIVDGYDGYIISKNEPVYIAEKIITSLNEETLELLSNNAMNAVRISFSKENAVKQWRVILN